MIWICIIIGLISFAGLVYSIIETDGFAILAIFSVFGLICSFVGILDLSSEKNKSYEYPATEYNLEYKITTIGEQSDTTYVLTKIKEDQYMNYTVKFFSPLRNEIMFRKIEANNAEIAQKTIQMYYRLSEKDILSIIEED